MNVVTQEKVIDSQSVEIGSLVIVNDMDRPCERLVAVVVEVSELCFVAQYLNADPSLDGINRYGLSGMIEDATPLGWFGVRMHLDAEGRYRCGWAGKSRAQYKDGSLRPWQGESGNSYFVSRRTVADRLLKNDGCCGCGRQLNATNGGCDSCMEVNGQ